jgi:hypothetical protein
LEYGSSSDGEMETQMDPTGALEVGQKDEVRWAESQRGSVDLLPLKFKGMSMRADEGEFIA